MIAITESSAFTDSTSLGMLILRVVVGVTIFLHGYNKFFGGGRIPGTARWFDSMGMKPNGKVHAVLAASTETGGGALFALGLLTPLAAAAIVGLMVVAAWTVHRKEGFFIVGGGWEYNLVLAAVAVAVATTGPGRFSIDRLLELDWATVRPALGLGLSLGLGLVGGVALILGCYRPPAPEPAVADGNGSADDPEG